MSRSFAERTFTCLTKSLIRDTSVLSLVPNEPPALLSPDEARERAGAKDLREGEARGLMDREKVSWS